MEGSVSLDNLSSIAKAVRRAVVKMIYRAGSGHPGGSLSATDLLVGLYFGGILEENDQFILSAGHLCPAWYAVLVQKSIIPQKRLKDLRRLGSQLQGHPDRKFADFVTTSTGSLGQGISVGLGMALAKKLKKEKGMIFVFSSDGEQEEGQVWEAAMLAAKQKLDNLCLVIDRNGMQIGGETEKITALEPLKGKYEAFGWQTEEIPGHEFEQIINALKKAKNGRGKPVVVIAKTIRGKGVSFMENQRRYHACSLTEEEYTSALEELK